jgi:hypothetical protein
MPKERCVLRMGSSILFMATSSDVSATRYRRRSHRSGYRKGGRKFRRDGQCGRAVRLGTIPVAATADEHNVGTSSNARPTAMRSSLADQNVNRASS